MNINTLFQTLRLKTGPAHKALEATYPFSQHMRQGAFSADAYARSLHVLMSFHRTATPAITLLPASVSQFVDPPNVLEALAKDLAALPPVTGEKPVFSAKLEDNSAEAAIAFSYVWMGSSMGGSIISRWLQKHHPQLPVNYYLSMTSAGANWEAYKSAALDFASASDLNESHCAELAVGVFDRIIQAAACYQAEEPASC